MTTCGHETTHPLNGLPFVCTRDEHTGNSGHVYEWKGARNLGEALARTLADLHRDAAAVGAALGRAFASLAAKP